MSIQLSDHFTYKKLLRFVFPSIIMMIFTSIYSIVDGLFVSNYVGKTAFASVNLIMPLIMGVSALGFMIGTGGSALVAKTLGEGEPEKANEYFSLLVYVTFLGGILLSLLGIFLAPQVASLLGASGELLSNSVLYARLTFLSMPAFMLQNVFQSFFVTAGKPKLGLYVILSAGLTNIVLDFLLVGVWHFGLAGAALATICGECIGGLFPVVYFLRPNSSLLRLGKTRLKLSVLGKTCLNGSSELMGNISSSLVSMLYNFQLLKYFDGNDGVAAYGVLMYVQFIFVAIFIGYAIGCAPIVSFSYGASNHEEMKNVLRKSMILMGGAGALLTGVAVVMAVPLAHLFVGYDAGLYTLTCHAFRLFAASFLLAGVDIFLSSFFTALNNGLVSAAISFLRTLVFQTSAVLFLPLVLNQDGIWWAVTVAEVCAFVISASFLFGMRKKYRYM